jgi:hypothetical protein
LIAKFHIISGKLDTSYDFGLSDKPTEMFFWASCLSAQSKIFASSGQRGWPGFTGSELRKIQRYLDVMEDAEELRALTA